MNLASEINRNKINVMLHCKLTQNIIKIEIEALEIQESIFIAADKIKERPGK